MPSIHEALERYASNVELEDERLVFLHLLLYDYGMQAPDLEDARHFRNRERFRTAIYFHLGGLDMTPEVLKPIRLHTK